MPIEVGTNFGAGTLVRVFAFITVKFLFCLFNDFQLLMLFMPDFGNALYCKLFSLKSGLLLFTIV